jgi:hypothetical protein
MIGFVQRSKKYLVCFDYHTAILSSWITWLSAYQIHKHVAAEAAAAAAAVV